MNEFKKINYDRRFFETKKPTTVMTTGLLMLTVLVSGSIFLEPNRAIAVNNDESPVCSTINLESSTDAFTAGFTNVNPDNNPLSPQSYSGQALTQASITEAVIPPWLDPETTAEFSQTSAEWISTDQTWPGGNGNTEGIPNENQWRLFEDSFTLPPGAVVSSAQISYTADDAVSVYLNQNTTPISSTGDVFEETPSSQGNHFDNVYNTLFTPVAGLNKLNIVIRNWNIEDTVNPTGLLYHASVEYCVPTNPNQDFVQVNIVKFVEGKKASASSAAGTSFPMQATWVTDNMGTGTGEYSLNSGGYGDIPIPYEAMTAMMNSGSDYTTQELTNSDAVGATCEAEKPFTLVGYTSGNNLAEASAMTPSLTVPAFTDLDSNKTVIVWNDDCAVTATGTSGTIGGEVTGGVSNNGELIVTSIDRIQTNATANNSFASGWKYIFHITTPNNEPELAMKFSDWMNTNSQDQLMTANNVRISSAQANNSGATVLLTTANTYSTPSLIMTTDLNPSLAGRQVEVMVEVKIPANTVNGSYTTSYGVRTLD